MQIDTPPHKEWVRLCSKLSSEVVCKSGVEFVIFTMKLLCIQSFYLPSTQGSHAEDACLTDIDYRYQLWIDEGVNSEGSAVERGTVASFDKPHVASLWGSPRHKAEGFCLFQGTAER